MGAQATKLDPKEQLRLQKRELKHAERKVDREAKKLERQQAKLKREIATLAKKGHHTAAKTMVKQSVRMDRQVNQFMNLKVNLSVVGMQLSSAATSQMVMGCLGKAGKVMGKANADMDIKSMQVVMKNYMMEAQKMGIKSEMMGDAMDDGEVDMAAEDEYEKVLAGIGLEIAQDGVAVPTKKVKKEVVVEEEAKDEEMDDLASRLMKI